MIQVYSSKCILTCTFKASVTCNKCTEPYGHSVSTVALASVVIMSLAPDKCFTFILSLHLHSS